MSRELTTLENKIKTIRNYIDRDVVKNQLARVLPKHLSPDRLLRVAMTSIQRNPKLLECSPQSLLACIMVCGELGLETDPFLGQAYLIPFWNSKKKCYEATLIPGYRGYITLARRSGEVQAVQAQVVKENDEFELEYGLNEKLRHVPSTGERGKTIGAYVVVRYKDGSYSFDYMSVDDIEKIRKRSKSPNDGPWVTDYDEMCKKTVIRRHFKIVPLSTEDARKLAALEEFMEATNAGITDTAVAMTPELADFFPSTSLPETKPEPESEPEEERKPAPPPKQTKPEPREEDNELKQTDYNTLFIELAKKEQIDINRLNEFAKHVALSAGVPLAEVKSKAIEFPEHFINSFNKWDKSKTPAEEPKQEEKNQTDFNWDQWMNSWIAMRTSKDPNKGFRGFVNDPENRKLFETAPKAVFMKAKRKYEKMYDEEFPIKRDQDEGARTEQTSVHSGENWAVDSEGNLWLACPESEKDVPVSECHSGCNRITDCPAYRSAMEAGKI